ncbi:hypothetical protein IEQ34_025248 [Dendrobium chrysotoxum]|uniref:Methyltransferase domain-containing protein n=1 Tax=Dendrobium chrysotoxum TaxID=161865 RepID=A0AAV7FR37_DENCH|nr:hypothetical protein IEQ34_025248 [Dendrobium chrysotoxum]
MPLGRSSWPATSPFIVFFVSCLIRFVKPVRTILVFAYTCFLQPIGKTAKQSERLDRFYQNQANVYDSTRSRLLRGRRTMLKLVAAQLRQMQYEQPGKKLVWVDIGGGTGWNIEQMAGYFPIEQIDQIYLVDLCEPLLAVARQRFNARGWKNVQVLCQDAREFTLPGLPEEQKVDLFTCSYSISMIPPFYAVLDRINDFLNPDTGVFGVVDFYVSGNSPVQGDKTALIGGDSRRGTTWNTASAPSNATTGAMISSFHSLSVSLTTSGSAARANVTPLRPFRLSKWKPETVSSFLLSFPELSFSHLLAATKAAEEAEKTGIDSGFASAAEGAVVHGNKLVRRRTSEATSMSSSSSTLHIALGPHVPLSSFHYQKRQWRLPYVDPDFASFRSFIYGFTWEDPYVDMQHLNLTKDSSILCITSAGDNALHYAISAEPKRIHCVDMNACQGHLLELKLACIAALDYEEFWSLFGAGKNEKFAEWLDSRISPYLSSHAYQFWRLNNHYFDRAFYFRGYTGHALRLAKFAFAIARVQKHVNAFCQAKTVEEQQQIWDKHLRGTMINRQMIRLVLSNPAFLWNALGVPMNQYNCFLNEGVSVEQFAIDTLDSMPSRTLVRNNNYHYQLCLQAKYTKDSCPLYLKKEAYKKLKQDAASLLDSFRLHTNSIVNVLRGSKTAASPTPSPWITWTDKSISDLDREIIELSRVVAKGGAVFWRSAAKRPWYNARFEKMGFNVEAVHIARRASRSTTSTSRFICLAEISTTQPAHWARVDEIWGRRRCSYLSTAALAPSKPAALYLRRDYAEQCTPIPVHTPRADHWIAHIDFATGHELSHDNHRSSQDSVRNVTSTQGERRGSSDALDIDLEKADSPETGTLPLSPKSMGKQRASHVEPNSFSAARASSTAAANRPRAGTDEFTTANTRDFLDSATSPLNVDMRKIPPINIIPHLTPAGTFTMDDAYNMGHLSPPNEESDPLLLRSKVVNTEQELRRRPSKGRRADGKVRNYYERQNTLIENLLKPIAKHASEDEEETAAANKMVKFLIYLNIFANFALAGLQLFAAISSLSLSLFATAADSVFDPFANVMLNWLHVKSAKIAWWIDPTGAIVISFGIIYSWSRAAHEQFRELCGAAAPVEFLQLGGHRHEAGHTSGLSHNVSQDLQDKIEQLPLCERAFVHVDFEVDHRPEHQASKKVK